jgi:uncharacterized membrane protein
MPGLSERLDQAEAQIRSLERELAELRRLAATGEEPEPPSLLPSHIPEPEPETAPVPPPSEFRLPPPREAIDWAGLLLDARVLAWTGGAVTLLGIAFFFVLAAERGWIGPVARVSLGAIASTLVFASGFELRRRYGDTYAALAAAGAGIAGAYMTLAASVLLYHQLTGPEALPIAALIAVAAAFAALRWNAQTLAVLGLLGAMLAPAAIALQSGSTVLGGAFAVVVLAPTTLIAVRRSWSVLQVAALLATAPQVLVLARNGDRWTLALVIACTFIYAAGGLALALRAQLTQLSAWLLMASAVFAGLCVGLLYSGTTEGVGLVAVAVVYAATSAALYRRERDTATLLWAVAVAIGGVAAADLASGATLTIVWSGEAAVLAWLARRLRDPRIELGALAWLVLAFAHAIVVDAPPSRLFVENPHPEHGVLSMAALAVAAAVVALATSEWLVRLGATVSAGVFALYGASLGVVSLPASWDWGHVAVAALWSVTAAVLALRFRTTALVLLGATVLLVGLYDLSQLADPQRWWACAPAAGAALVVALAIELAAESSGVRIEALAVLVASGAFAAGAVAGLLGGAEGYGLLAVGAGYLAVGGAVLHRRRDFASALGVVGLVFMLVASRELLDGTWLVLAWAAACAVLALAARFEQRLEYAALVFLALGLAHALSVEAAPRHLFVSQRSPGTGFAALVLLVAAIAVFAYERVLGRAALLWTGAVLVLYAASLGVLQLAESAGASVDTAFQRGHTGVSALWALAGACLLYAGIRRGERALQFGGIALFAVSLAKLFLYDLAFLSSITRALSFLAVGAMLLAAGFAYQRLSARPSP